MITVAALLVASNVLYIQDGEIKVGKIRKQVGNVTYVTPCENESQIYRVPVQRSDMFGKTSMSCGEYRDLRRNLR